MPYQRDAQQRKTIPIPEMIDNKKAVRLIIFIALNYPVEFGCIRYLVKENWRYIFLPYVQLDVDLQAIARLIQRYYNFRKVRSAFAQADHRRSS